MSVIWNFIFRTGCGLGSFIWGFLSYQILFGELGDGIKFHISIGIGLFVACLSALDDALKGWNQ